jgi:hypothetical protein
MLSVEELFASNKYPKWISTNPVFSNIQYIRKVFPSIGLPNFEEKLLVDNTSEIISSANQLLDVITDNMNARTVKLSAFAGKAKIGKKRRRQLDFTLSVMSTLMHWLRTNKKSFIVASPTGKVSLNIPEDLSAKDTLFLKKGTSLLKIYEKVNTILQENKFLALKDLSQAFQFKNFSSINIPSKEMFVKFSSDQEEGFWDIVTMSMRGIQSCQTWEQGIGNSCKVIGSMLDPFTGIIYFTGGGTFNSYGSRMIRRCIVRYVIDHTQGYQVATTKTPYLLLEKMYPAFDKPSLDAFIKAIKDRVPNIEVLYTTEVGTKAITPGTKLFRSYVPLSDEMKALDGKYYPYCDSALSFREDPDCIYSKNTELPRLLFKKKIPKLFEKAIKSNAFKQVNIKPFGADATKLLTQLRKAKLKSKIGLAGDPNAVQICNCTHASCNRNHTPLDDISESTLESTTETDVFDAEFVSELGTKFTDFVCQITPDNDPFTFLTKNRKECAAFFTSEFNNTINSEFADFLVSNIVEYIEQKI